MSKIILIETSTAQCSTAICENGHILCSRRSSNIKEQASLTAPFIKEMLDECAIGVSDCSAVCVSAGPGSYTGLRVGSSTAKGLCFAAGIPLLSLCSLDILCRQAIEENLLPPDCKFIIPMIDARRMEVYTAVYDTSGNKLTEVEAKVINPDSFASLRSEGNILFIGDGAGKCADALQGSGSSFIQTWPDACAMVYGATHLLEEGRYENTAYFEPFYLKQFQATVSRKKLF